MTDIINVLGGKSHLLTLIILVLHLLFLIRYANVTFSEKLLKLLLSFNILSYYSILMMTNSFDFKIHLPIHLCYITEIFIIISYIFNTKYFYPWIVLNGLGGGISGFLNSIMVEDSVPIEYVHHYLSHFNLLLFVVIFIKSKFHISKIDFLKSIILNLLIFCTALSFNQFFESNYWFTKSKPSGNNLSFFFPERPYYLFMFIGIGLVSYFATYFLIKKNTSTNEINN
tara:strand:- start:1674 stop:2354 length:681 start_codon:yes stop_codon:yes gene_type:complete